MKVFGGVRLIAPGPGEPSHVHRHDQSRGYERFYGVACWRLRLTKRAIEMISRPATIQAMAPGHQRLS
ncbi:MAG TPA: hypothetical protein VH593_09980 [Ktedonobacteraceae bacterium]